MTDMDRSFLMNLITAFMIAAAIQASSPDRERFLPSPEAVPPTNLASQDPISVGIGQPWRFMRTCKQ